MDSNKTGEQSLDLSDFMLLYPQDMEFNGYLQIARDLMKKMRLAEDRRVCEKYIRSCLLMSNSEQSIVKFHRNRFFRFLLKTMRKTVESQESVFVNFPEGVHMLDGQEMTQWSADRRSYVAAKIIPGYGTLVYMACTDVADSEWEENGFCNFLGIESVPNLAMFNQAPSLNPAQQGSTNPANLSPTAQAFLANPNIIPASRATISTAQQNPTVTFAPTPAPSRISFPASGPSSQTLQAGPVSPSANIPSNPTTPPSPSSSNPPPAQP